MASVALPYARRIVAIVAAMLVVLASSGKAHASVPRPTAASPLVETAGHLDVFVDESGAMTVDEVLARPDLFSPAAPGVPNVGVTRHALWVRLALEGAGTPMYAEVPYPVFDHLTFVEERESGERRIVRTGDRVPFAQRAVEAPTFVFDVAGDARTIVIRVQSEGNVSAPLRLWEPRAFERHTATERLGRGIFLGIIAAMAAYNLFLFFLLRDRVYVYSVGFLVAFGTFELCLSGLGFMYVWGESVWAQNHLNVMSMVLVAAFLFRLCTTAADIRAHLPRQAAVLQFIERVLVVLGIAALVVPQRVVIAGVLAVGPLGGAVVLWALAARARAGSAAAGYMLAGNVALIVGLAVFAFKSGGLLPSNALTDHMKDIGVVFQVVLLSLALAARIRTLQGEVARNQRIALAASERTADELTRLNQLKDDFLANTSHELRTPLNGILGLAESLVSGAPDAGTKRTADLILTSGRRLSTIVDDVLAFATLRKDDAALGREKVDVGAVVDAVKDTFDSQARDKKLALLVDKKLDDRGVLGETARVEQVLHHLVSNAIKFTESGTITIGAVHEGGRVRLAVTDTGAGIDEAARASLFNVFEQADGSAKRDTGGLGLGLPLAKRIVELLGGELAVESKVGAGTTFSFSLEACALPPPAVRVSTQAPARVHAFTPVTRSIAPPPPPSSQVRNADVAVIPSAPRLSTQMVLAGGLSSGRVLAVDDEPINLAVLARQLGNEGFEVVKASSGPEALEIVRQATFDIVLLDVMMPRMSGYEVCRTIRQELGNVDMPVVLVTAKNQEQDLVDGFDCGANDYIRKPFTKGELVARVHAHVREYRTRKSIGRFVPREFLRLLGRSQVTDVQLGDQVEREITVLFSDIRDFTKLCESLTPDDTFRFINRCLERLGPEVRAHGGFIDKYIGDAIMALFPKDGDGALRAAVAMQRAVDAFNAEEPLAVPLAIGIGLHRGRTMLGTIGEEERMEATVVSDTVNVASRLEGLTKTFGARVLVSESLVENARALGMTLRSLGHVHLKGRGAAVEVFETLDADPDGLRWAKIASTDTFADGVAAYEAGDLAGARACFERVLERCPDDRAAKYFVGESRREHDVPVHSLVQGA